VNNSVTGRLERETLCRDDEISEDTQKDSTHDEYHQDSRGNWSGAKLSGLLHKAKKEGPEKLPSGIQDSSPRHRHSGEQEDQPRDVVMWVATVRGLLLR